MFFFYFKKVYNKFVNKLKNKEYSDLSCVLPHFPSKRYKDCNNVQSNFNGSNTFGTMKICSRQG